MRTINSADISASGALLQEELDTEGVLFFRGLNGISPQEALSLFGALRLQEDGAVHYTVKAGEKLQPVDGGALMPHTDDFNSDGVPPRIGALYCVQPDERNLGNTLLADGYDWLSALAPHALALLEREWVYRKGPGSVVKKFLERSPARSILRVSFGHLQFTHNEEMKEVMMGLSQWFTEHAMKIVHERGSMLLWNNWRMIHGRTAYHDLDRELHRFHLD